MLQRDNLVVSLGIVDLVHRMLGGITGPAKNEPQKVWYGISLLRICRLKRSLINGEAVLPPNEERS